MKNARALTFAMSLSAFAPASWAGSIAASKTDAGDVAKEVEKYCREHRQDCENGADTVLFFVPPSTIDQAFDLWLGPDAR